MERELPPATIYGNVIAWERPIQIVAADWLRPSDTIYDVGANTGGLAIAFARLVADGGKVFAFECNPFMADWAQRDAEANGMSNIQIIRNACFSSSNLILEFYCDDSYYSASSSLMTNRPGRRIEVKTKSLDDFCIEINSPPRFIKIDVEGAEPHVLDGSSEIISKCRPVIVIEYSGQPDNDRNPIRMLQRMDYKLFDVNTYQVVDDSYMSQKYATNVVAIPAEYPDTYRRERSNSVVSQIDPTTWQAHLEAGRYVLESILTFDNAGAGAISVRDSNGAMLALYHAAFQHLKHHACSSIVLQMEKPDIVTIKVESKSNGALIFINNVMAWSISRHS